MPYQGGQLNPWIKGLVIFNLMIILGGCGFLSEKDFTLPKEKELSGDNIRNPFAERTQEFQRRQQEIKRVEDLLKNELTDEQKRAIDQWLKDNNLNPFGDPPDTVYAGGTPLFNEETGEHQDRYHFLLRKHPELVKIVLEIDQQSNSKDKK
ncbi:hypothetical protein D6821_01995 [Candidatus Parcubacteria bacterium]|nr:MAG: hypothetical protein D6821_01995 [Candidatus Parcubacteria bacterium]